MKSNRRKAAKKRKNDNKDRVRQQWKTEHKQILSSHKKAPYIKMILRSRGCQLKFFDFLDSYEAQFSKLVDEYLASRPSLIGIYEVDDNGLKSTDWKYFGGDSDWQQVFYNCEDDMMETYGKKDKRSNILGNMVTLMDTTDGIHTMVRIRKKLKGTLRHKENQYAQKIPALLHEVGHVIDVEERINFDPEKKTGRILDAEVFAHRYALEQCLQREYRQSFIIWLDSLRGYVDAKDYRGEVARRTLDGIQTETDILDWIPLYQKEITEDELTLIGEHGRQTLA